MPASRVAVVTGAGSGIGRELALACAREGMAVVVADVESEALAQTHALVEAEGAACLAQRCDMSNAAEVDLLAEVSCSRWGGADWLFNNAGVAVLGTAWEATDDDWQWVLGVNLMGVVHGVRSFVPRMRARGTPAHIVNTASAAGLATVGGSAVYCASKHAVVAFSECLAKDLEQAGSPIGVSVLCPGFIRTNILDFASHIPERYAGSTNARPVAEWKVPDAAAQERIAFMRRRIAEGIDPLYVGELVREGIEDNALYLFTDTEFEPLFDARVAEIKKGFDRIRSRKPRH